MKFEEDYEDYHPQIIIENEHFRAVSSPSSEGRWFFGTFDDGEYVVQRDDQYEVDDSFDFMWDVDIITLGSGGEWEGVTVPSPYVPYPKFWEKLSEAFQNKLDEQLDEVYKRVMESDDITDVELSGESE